MEGNTPAIQGGRGSTQGDFDFEDVYLVFIDNPAEFSATTAPQFEGNAEFDSRLYLFSPQGLGLLANDDTFIIGRGGKGLDSGSTLNNFATDDSGVVIDEPGLYLIGITVAPRFPANNQGQLYDFQFEGEVSGPDGPGGESPFEFWQIPQRAESVKGNGKGSGALYEIALTGVTFAAPAGACCLPGDTCEELGEEECALRNGIYQGHDTFCDVATCDDACGDLDDDGDVDADDLALLLAAYGSSIGDSAYRSDADFNSDGAIGLVDYGIWFECYETFNSV